MMWSNLKSITQSWSMDSSTWIGLSKLGTLAWIFTLIFVHEVFTITAFLYLAFYISYVLLYFVKNTVMADKAFDRKINVMDVMLTVPILFGTYWLIPYIAIVYGSATPPSGYGIFLSLLTFNTGMTLILLSDYETTFMLQQQPQLLLSEQDLDRETFSLQRGMEQLGMDEHVGETMESSSSVEAKEGDPSERDVSTQTTIRESTVGTTPAWPTSLLYPFATPQMKAGKAWLSAEVKRLIVYPNIAGEVLIYLSFCMLSSSWLSMLVLLVTWSIVFWPVNRYDDDVDDDYNVDDKI